MAVTAGTAYYSSADASSHAISYPASIASGNTLVYVVSSKTQDVSSGPSGFTESGTGVSNATVSLFTHIYYKTASGSESGTESVTLAASAPCCGVIIKLDGTEGGSFDTTTFDESSGTASTPPAATAAQSGSLIIRVHTANNDTGSAAAATIPSGTTLIQQGDTSGGGSLGQATAYETDADTSIAANAYSNGWTYWNAATVVVSPAASSGGALPLINPYGSGLIST